MDNWNFLSDEAARAIGAQFGTPVFVYSQARLEDSAREVLSFPNAFGLTARFAMKALPNREVLRIFDGMGLHIDASSGYEAERALRAGIRAERIQLTAQELPANLGELVEQGVLFNACSIHQLRYFGRMFPGSEVSVRINPGLGSGHSNRTNVGGPSSSFGIWHEHLDRVFAAAEEFKLKITRMHTHIGSGGDPEVWKRCARLSLAIAATLREVRRLNLGGGFKVGRMPGEASADLQEIGETIKGDIEEFSVEHGRELHIELEPGTFLVANAGAIVASVIDVVDTGEQGYEFVKVDCGMTEVLRPSMYGAQHPMKVVPLAPGSGGREGSFVVVGHCCESGDVLTPAPGEPEALEPIRLLEPMVGDLLVIGGAGAYCSAMPAKNYNSFPAAPEVLVRRDGSVSLIRRRQILDAVVADEVG